MLANLVYCVALVLVSPVVVYRAIRHGRYRRGIRDKLWGLSPSRALQLRNASSGDSRTTGAAAASSTRPLLWLHAVSVGEVNLLPPLIRRLQSERPGLRVVVSTSTDSGYDLAVSRFGSDRVFFCPLDFTWSVRRTLRNLNPDAIVLVELELWPNLIRLATRRGCSVAVVNARLSERTAAGYQRFAAVTRGTFRRLAWVGCQDEATADKFLACGTRPDRVRVTGSIKFDNAPDSREVAEVQQRCNWAGDRPLAPSLVFRQHAAGRGTTRARGLPAVASRPPGSPPDPRAASPGAL